MSLGRVSQFSQVGSTMSYTVGFRTQSTTSGDWVPALPAGPTLRRTCYSLLELLTDMVVQIRILDNSNHCLEMYGIINIILYITSFLMGVIEFLALGWA